MGRSVAALAVVVFCVGDAWGQIPYITLDYPGGKNTQLYGIDGSNVVGSYTLSNNQYGFVYNLSTSAYTAPLAYPQGENTTPFGISGNNVVGTYVGISGNNVNSGIYHGFLYNCTLGDRLSGAGRRNRLYAEAEKASN